MAEPENKAGSSRLLALPALFLCVFGVSAMILTRVVPGPLKELDYMVIGTVAVMIGLLAVFLVIIRSTKSGDPFFSRRPVSEPRKRRGTSILDLDERGGGKP
ncbi:MAG: hypothetical protein ABJF23_19540 [Bryobacteraceae bacterium]